MSYCKKVMKKKLVSLLLVLMMIIQSIKGNMFISYAVESSTSSESSVDESNNVEETIKKETTELTNNDLDVAIVNYMAVKSYELSENKDNFIELGNIQKLIIDGLSVEGFKNDYSQDFVINKLLTTITDLKLDAKSRDRATDKLNEKEAIAITKGAKATAETIASMDKSNVVGGIIGGIGAAGVGFSTYDEAIKEAKTEYNDMNFEIDKDVMKQIDGLKTQLFNYMINISKTGNVRDDSFLKEPDIRDFYEAKTTSSIQLKIDKLKNIEKKFSKYGPYWLECSRAYYQRAFNGKDEKEIYEDYKKSVEAFETYEKLDNSFYSAGYNYEYYDHIQEYLVSVEKVKSNEYINIATKYAKILDENVKINNENYSKNIYLIKLYEELGEKTNNKIYLNKAYERTRQLTLNKAVKLKENNKNAYESDGKSPSQDDSVIFCIYLLKELAEKTNKTEKELENLDNQIFGEDGNLFYNFILDTKLAFSNTELEKRRKNLFNNGLGKTIFNINEIKSGWGGKNIESEVNFYLDKKLARNRYAVHFEFADSKNAFSRVYPSQDDDYFHYSYFDKVEFNLLNDGGAILLHISLSDAEKEVLEGKIEELRFRFDYGVDIDEDGSSNENIGWNSNICSYDDVDALEVIFGADYKSYIDQVSEME